MEKKFRTRLIVAAALFIVALVVTLILVTRLAGEADPVPAELTMIVPWTGEAEIDPLEREIPLFEETYPWITVNIETMPMGDLNRLWTNGWPAAAPDLATVSIGLSEDAVLRDPLPWTGTPWALYVNTRVMEQAGVWEDGIPLAWLQGTLTLADLEESFATIHASGATPVSVGGRFIWPLAAWVQHLGILSGREIVPGEASYDASDLAEITAVWDRWQTERWLVDQWRTTDWPSSVRGVAAGDAAMALLAGSMAAAFPPNSAGIVVPVPFPSGSDANWTVGSLINLAIPAASEHPEAARLLLDFFTSDGVTQRLTQRTQMLFYAASGTRQPGRVYASVTNDHDSAVMDYLQEYIRR